MTILNFADEPSFTIPANMLKYFHMITSFDNPEEFTPAENIERRDVELLVNFYESFIDPTKLNDKEKEFYMPKFISQVYTDSEILTKRSQFVETEIRKLKTAGELDTAAIALIDRKVRRRVKLIDQPVLEDATAYVGIIDKMVEDCIDHSDQFETEVSGTKDFLCFYPEWVKNWFDRFANPTDVGFCADGKQWDVEEEIEVRARNEANHISYNRTYCTVTYDKRRPSLVEGAETLRKKHADAEYPIALAKYKAKCPIHSPFMRINDIVYTAVYFDCKEFVIAATRYCQITFRRNKLPEEMTEHILEIWKETDDEYCDRMLTYTNEPEPVDFSDPDVVDPKKAKANADSDDEVEDDEEEDD
jgi:hypothetical protein